MLRWRREEVGRVLRWRRGDLLSLLCEVGDTMLSDVLYWVRDAHRDSLE